MTDTTNITADQATIEAADQALIETADQPQIEVDHTSGDQAQEAASEAQEAAEGRGEAARYRRRLRDVEAERDGLLAQLEAMRRAEVGRLVTEQRVWQMKPAALWAAGTDLAALLTEDGAVDPVKVAAAIAVAGETLGAARVPVAPSAYGQGNIGKPITSGDSNPSWGQVLRG